MEFTMASMDNFGKIKPKYNTGQNNETNKCPFFLL